MINLYTVEEGINNYHRISIGDDNLTAEEVVSLLDELAVCNEAWKQQGKLLIERKREINRLVAVLDWIESYDNDAVLMAKDYVAREEKQ